MQFRLPLGRSPSGAPGKARWPWGFLVGGVALAVTMVLGSRPHESEADAPPPLRGSSWVVVGARVLMPDGDELVSREGLAVLGRGSRIEAVAALAELGSLPADTVTIDGAGATLLPGLMDAWCQLRDPTDLDCALAAGVTTLRVMDSPGWLARVLKERAKDQIPTPRCVAFGRDLRRHVARNPVKEGLEGPALRGVIEADVARQTKDGVAGFTLGHDASSELLRMVLDATWHHRLPLSIRTPGKTFFRRIVSEGDAIGSIETFLGEWLFSSGRRRKPGPVPTANELAERVASAVEARRVILTGLIEFTTARRILESESNFLAKDFVTNRYDLNTGGPLLASADELARLAPLTRACWSQAAHQLRRNLPLSFLRSFQEAEPLVRGMVRQLGESGATLVVGTGAGSPFVPVGPTVVDEVLLLREMGLSPSAALVAATSAAASFIGVPLAGKIAPGRTADLLLVDGDPLTNPEALRNVRSVARGGVWMGREALTARLKTNQVQLDREIEFVLSTTILSIGSTAEDAERRLEFFVEEHGVHVRRETVETIKDIYESVDVPRPEHAKVLERFLQRYFEDDM